MHRRPPLKGALSGFSPQTTIAGVFAIAPASVTWKLPAETLAEPEWEMAGRLRALVIFAVQYVPVVEQPDVSEKIDTSSMFQPPKVVLPLVTMENSSCTLGLLSASAEMSISMSFQLVSIRFEPVGLIHTCWPFTRMRAWSKLAFSTCSQRCSESRVPVAPLRLITGERSQLLTLLLYAPFQPSGPRSLPQMFVPPEAATVGSPTLPNDTLAPTWLERCQS